MASVAPPSDLRGAARALGGAAAWVPRLWEPAVRSRLRGCLDVLYAPRHEAGLPLSPDEHQRLGAMAALDGDWELALHHADCALNASTGSAGTAGVLHDRAVALRHLGRNEEALHALDSALVDPGSERWITTGLEHERAAALGVMGRAAEAAAAYREVFGQATWCEDLSAIDDARGNLAWLGSQSPGGDVEPFRSGGHQMVW